MVLRELALQLAHFNSSQGLVAFGLPTPVAQPASAMVANEIARYDATTQAAMRDEHVPQLNPEQRAVYDNVMAAVNHFAFFVDGLGGTGKTFLYSCLLSTLRAQGRVAIAVASSGIAALLLDGGRTAHSRFKIPVQSLNSTSTCYISRDSKLATLLQAATLIVWDEAVMMHMHVFEAVNRSLQDIMAVINPTFKFLPFGGLVVVFGGDFRQILLVVPRGTKGDVVAAALNRSSIWQHVCVFKLHTNMCVQRLLAQGGAHAQADATRQQAFADYLQRVGEGAENVYPSIGEDSILIPHDMCCNGPIVADLIKEVYGALSIVEYDARSTYIIERAILTPLNEDVDSLNKLINDKYAFTKQDGSPAQHRMYYSADSVVHGEQHGIYPTEFLNTLIFSGIPPHELHLQEGCPIILLCNMTSGLANGTRLIVIQLMQHVIEAEVATGPAKGQRVFIPRLSITPSDTE
jgi:ATP-dependent DNA helicase PIF1